MKKTQQIRLVSSCFPSLFDKTSLGVYSGLMSFSIWKQRFARNYKKYVAITLSCIGIAFLLGSFIANAIVSANNGESGLDYGSLFSNTWNFILLAVAYGYLFYGNLHGTSIAYRGMLIFIFYVLWDFGYYLMAMIMNLVSASSTGDPTLITIMVLLFLGTVFALISGIMCYFRTRQYLTSRYAKYEMVRLWALFFMLSVLIGGGLTIASYFLLFGEAFSPLYIFYMLLEPISMMLMSIVCFFSVLRLKSNY